MMWLIVSLEKTETLENINSVDLTKHFFFFLGQQGGPHQVLILLLIIHSANPYMPVGRGFHCICVSNSYAVFCFVL